jgi:hypothetical protein
MTLYEAQIRIKWLESQLAECYRLTGADPDGDSDACLAEFAVDEVRRMREENDRIEAQS